jgi:hypothetical protein
MSTKTLAWFQGVEVVQDDDRRVHFVANLDCDVDGDPHAYRLDNNPKLAKDDIHASAGWPHDEWWNVLVPDPEDEDRPYVNADGYCVSMTSYQREGFERTDNDRYLDASKVPYAVIPGLIRKVCKGVLLGCRARVTLGDVMVECVTGDFSGYNIGEASELVCKAFDPLLSARNGDDRKIYLFEFWPGTIPLFDDPITGKPFELKPLRA